MPDVDCVLIQNGKAHEIWRGIATDKLPPLHPDLVAQTVEAPAGTVNDGDAWDAELSKFVPQPVDP